MRKAVQEFPVPPEAAAGTWRFITAPTVKTPNTVMRR